MDQYLHLDPGGPIRWIIVGLIAGALASRVMRGRGLGCLGDIVVGILGAFIGGFVLNHFIQGTVDFWGSILVAFVGALILLAILGLIAPGQRYRY